MLLTSYGARVMVAEEACNMPIFKGILVTKVNNWLIRKRADWVGQERA